MFMSYVACDFPFLYYEFSCSYVGFIKWNAEYYLFQFSERIFISLELKCFLIHGSNQGSGFSWREDFWLLIQF